MARITAEDLQVGAKARGPGAGALGLAGQRGDVAGVLGGGAGQRGCIGFGGARGRRGVEASRVALRSELPCGQHRHGDRCCQADRYDVPAEQREDGRAHQG
ncbi:hypothetical protein DFH01_13625 [Falsiroseomonas bella]|uniref:Uncharacterized protein n=1 Tax=Falsiroseomonas bella TaxID=2184016 RepID=A0A317FF78_9PROT|nr:hypothetical protein DFH01_13625 [Falsiroseomonas bella]